MQKLFYTKLVSDIQNIIDQLEQQKSAIDNAIAALRGVSGMPTVAARGPGRPKGSTSAATKQAGISEGRQRQIEAMRRYWAQKKAAAKKAPGKATRKGGGGMTPEGRKRLSEMMRKRWAAKRAG